MYYHVQNKQKVSKSSTSTGQAQASWLPPSSAPEVGGQYKGICLIMLCYFSNTQKAQTQASLTLGKTIVQSPVISKLMNNNNNVIYHILPEYLKKLIPCIQKAATTLVAGR